MKKFLTVLLALSVVFTYSFSAVGSVFADTKTAEDYLDDAYQALSTRLESDYTTAVSGLADDTKPASITYKSGTVKVTFTADVKEKVAGEIKTYFQNVLDAKLAEVLANKTTLASITNYKAAESALKAAVTSGDYKDAEFSKYNFPSSLIYSKAGSFQKYFLQYALDEVKSDAADHLSRVDLTLYPDTVMDKNDPFNMTHNAFATEVRDEYLANLADIVVTAEDLKATNAIDLIAKKVADAQAIDGKVIPAYSVTLTDGTIVVYTYKFKSESYIAGYTGATPVQLAVSDDLEEGEKTLTVEKTAALADVQKLAAEFKKDALTAYNKTQKTDTDKATLAAAQDEADAFVEVLTVKIAEAKTTTDIPKPSFKYAGYNFNADTYTDVVAAYEALEDKAAAAKLEVGEAGTVKYIASIIDENLADAKIEIYTQATNALAIKKAAAIDITAGALREASLEWAKEVAIAQLAASEESALQDKYGNAYYYEKEAAQVAEAFDKVEAAINACTTVAQVKAVNKTPQIAAIPKKAAVEKSIRGLVKFSSELNKLNQYLTAQNMLNNATKVTDDNYRAKIAATDLAKFYAEKGARTNDEIVALLEEAKAWVMETPTAKELKDEKTALEAQIAALPKLIALTDKAAVKAAWEANENRSCAAPKNEATLKAAVEIVKSIEKTSIDKLINALPSTITVSDKAAVQAIADAIKSYDTEAMYKTTYVKTGFDLTKAQNAVRDSELAALEEAIAKLPKNASAAQVKAVRDQYDAFVKEYTDAVTGYDAAAHVSNDYRLFYAETQVKADIIKSTESLKISVSTKLYKGSKIRVNWKVKDGDASYITGYQVYKSKKAQSGYTIMGKTTKTYMDNKKNLKKGTRYYYKVRAYVDVDGERYYSDWSNKGNRIYK